MSDYAGMTVADILKLKRGSIKNAPLDPGSPSWDDVRHLTWEEVWEAARRNRRGFRTIKKLLRNGEYDK